MRSCLSVLFVASAVFAGEYRLPPPATGHPRLLFGLADVPAIRERACTHEGRAMVEGLARDAAVLAGKVTRAATGDLTDPRVGGRWLRDCRDAAALAWATGDSTPGDTAAAAFRLWLAANDGTDARNFSFKGLPEAALCYDLLADRLSRDDRRIALDLLVNSVKGWEPIFADGWYLGGVSQCNRNPSNWTFISASNFGLTALAIRGDAPVDEDLVQQSIHFMEKALTDGIAVDGAMYEGMSYPMVYGTDRTPLFLVALRRLGVDLIATTHLSRVPVWMSYEQLPWGGKAQTVNQSRSYFLSGCFTTFLSGEFGGPADWIYANVSGMPPGPRSFNDPIIGLLNALPRVGVSPPTELPPAHWFSTAGIVICRSGWGPDDAHLHVNTNALGSGHSHADCGSFCFADRRVNWIRDTGSPWVDSYHHNVVLVDGVGQCRAQGSTAGFIRAATLSGYADAVDIDLSLAYGQALANGHEAGIRALSLHNPVRQADRAILFVRGVTGPILAVADLVRKDDQEREYRWLAHTPANNAVVAGDGEFTIHERFGGDYLAAGNGVRQIAFTARDVPPGQWTLWVLSRSAAHAHRWPSYTTVTVAGTKRWNALSSMLGQFDEGWGWNQVKEPFDLAGGDAEIVLERSDPEDLAAVVLAADPEWRPPFELPLTAEGLIVLAAADAHPVPGQPAWRQEVDPRSSLRGCFLGTQPTVTTAANPDTDLPEVHAVIQGASARFACVMGVVDGRGVHRVGPNAVRWASPAGEDVILSGVATAGDLRADAVLAAVAIVDQQVGTYAVLNGRELQHADIALVAADRPLTVVNDGHTVAVRGPGGATVTCQRLGATALTLNGEAAALDLAADTITASLPTLPEEWTIEIAADGRYAELTGNGPPDIGFHAPDLRNVRVNGVNRWFVRDRQGNVYPALAAGNGWFPGELDAAALAAATPGAVVDSRGFLRLTPPATLVLPATVPATYALTLLGRNVQPLTLTAGDRTAELAPSDNVGMAYVDRFVLAGRTPLTITGGGELELRKIVLEPELPPIAAAHWRLAGPFPSAWGIESKDVALVVAALAGDVEPVWQTARPDARQGVRFDRLGVLRRPAGEPGAGTTGRVCWAETFIHSPADRPAILGLQCNWWANASLNGERVRPDRPPEIDGVDFTTDGLARAAVHLRAGWNRLLVKCHGGTGGSWFIARLTDPGDLAFSPTPPTD